MPVVTVEKVYSKFNPLSIGVEPLLIYILYFIIGDVWGFEGFDQYKYYLFVYTVEFPLFV